MRWQFSLSVCRTRVLCLNDPVTVVFFTYKLLLRFLFGTVIYDVIHNHRPKRRMGYEKFATVIGLSDGTKTLNSRVSVVQ